MTFGLVGFFGMNYVLFWFCQNTVGVQLPFAYMFFAFALSRLLTSVTVTPGGLGVSETGVAALLVGWGALGWLAWWLGPKVGAAQPQGGSSSTTNGTNT